MLMHESRLADYCALELKRKGPGSSVTSRKEKPMMYKHILFHRLKQTHGVQLFILPALLNMIKPIGQGAVWRDMTSLQILFLRGELQEFYKIYLYHAVKEKEIAIPLIRIFLTTKPIVSAQKPIGFFTRSHSIRPRKKPMY